MPTKTKLATSKAEDPKKKYPLKLNRMTVDKLGVKLYDQASAVVAELVANAYDADAEEVVIDVPLDSVLADKVGKTKVKDLGHRLVVKDDGHGMTPEEVKRFYLHVGKERRKDAAHGAKSRKKKRPVMGRKGVGKLAPFGICKRIEVRSAGGGETPSGYRVAHLVLNYDKIARDTDEQYFAEPGPDDEKFDPKPGTTITLSNFNPHKVPPKETFERQLAARFGIKRPDWNVIIRDSTGAHAPFDVGEFNVPHDKDAYLKADKYPVLVPGKDPKKPKETLKVKGFIAKAKKSYKDPESAGIRIYARGKIVAKTRDFEIQTGFTGEQVLRSYLVGAITCDWLDDDDNDDLVKTDRQDILWDSERGRALRDWGRQRLRELGAMSVKPARQDAEEVFFEKSNLKALAAKEYKETALQEAVIEVGRMLGATTSMTDLQDQEHVKRLANLCITIAPQTVLLETLREAAKKDSWTFTSFVEHLSTARIAEDASLGQVARIRVDAIDRLVEAKDKGANELVFQKIIEEAPWLINPQWTPLSRNETFETIRDEFPKWYKKTYKKDVNVDTETFSETSTLRPDFVMLAVESRIVVVELKKPHRPLPEADCKRMLGYHDSIEKFLAEYPKFKDAFPKPVKTILVADKVSVPPELRMALEGLEKKGQFDRYSWTEFTAAARQAHQDFLAVRRKLRKPKK